MPEQVLNLVLNPTIDLNKFNAIISSMKTAFKDLSPINESRFRQMMESVKPNIVGISESFNQIHKGLDETAKNANVAQRAVSGFSKAFEFNNMLSAVNNIAGAFNSIAGVGIDFESNMAAVGSITGFAGKELDALGDSARRLAKEFGGSAVDQLKSMQGVLSKIGPELAKDAPALELLTKNINTLSTASGDGAAASMQAITDTMMQMGLAMGTPMEIAQKSTDVINALAGSAKVGAAEIPEVASALVNAGVAAKGANLNIVDVNTAIQLLAVGGKRGSEAGTALRNILGYLQKASGPAAAAMKEIGTSSDELGKILTTQGLDAALLKIKEGMNKLGTDTERNTALIKIFGNYSAQAAGVMINNLDKWKEFHDGIEAGMQGTGDAFIQAAQRADTAEGYISVIQAHINDLYISLSQTAGKWVNTLIATTTQISPIIATFTGLKDLVPQGAIDTVREYSSIMLSKLVPGLISQDVVTKKLVFNKNALNLTSIRQRALDAYQVAQAKVLDAMEQLRINRTKVMHALQVKGLAIKERILNFNIREVAESLKANVADAKSAFFLKLKTAETAKLNVMQKLNLLVHKQLNKEKLKATFHDAKSVVFTIMKTTALAPLITAQLAYNAALKANPIGLVVVAIAGLVAGFTLLYKNVKGFRTFADGMWNVMKTGAEEAWKIIKQFGDVLLNIGKVALTVVATPFVVTYNIIKSIGTAIGEFLASIMGVDDTATMLQNLADNLTAISDTITSILSSTINFLQSTVDGITSFAGSVGSAIGDVFTGDFGGAIDSLFGAGEKASEAFNYGFNQRLRQQNFDEANKVLERGLAKAGEIEVKVKTKTDYENAVSEFEKINAKIKELNEKKKAGNLTANEGKELENLSAKSQKIGENIAKIAPNAIKGIKDIKVVNGEVVKTYDINIAKAKEFMNASDFSTPLLEQKKAVSGSLTEMSKQYGSQTHAIKTIQSEIKKVGASGEGFDKLQSQLKEATAQAEGMRKELVDGLLQAGSQGLVTDDAIKSVAKSLGMTEQEARKMMLAEELKKVNNSGLVTESIINDIADKYKISREEARKVAEESKKQTANVQDTTREVLSLADAWKAVGDRSSGAFDKSKSEQKSLLFYAKLNAKQYETFKKTASKGELELAEKARNMTANERKKLLAEKRAEAKEQKELLNLQESVNKQVDGTYEKKSGGGSAKKVTTEYEKQSDVLDEIRRKQELRTKEAENELKNSRLMTGFIETEKSKLEDSYLIAKRKLEDLKEQRNQMELIQKSINSIKDPKERSDAEKRMKSEFEAIDIEIKNINNDMQVFNKQLDDVSDKFKKELAKINAESKRNELEFKVKLGLANNSDLLKFEIEDLLAESMNLTGESTKLQLQLSADTENLELQAKLKELQNKLYKNHVEIKNKEKDLDYKLNEERINQIVDLAERQRALSNLELKKRYSDEIREAKGNAGKIVNINLKRYAEEARIQKEYFANTIKGYADVQKFLGVLGSIKFGRKDNSEIDRLKGESEALRRKEEEAENEYFSGKKTFEEYQQALTDIQNEQAQNRIDIERAEAESRKELWADTLQSLAKYFDEMQQMYFGKANTSFTTIENLQKNITELEDEQGRNRAELAEKENQLKLETNKEAQAQIAEAIAGLTNLITTNDATVAQSKKELAQKTTDAYAQVGIAAGAVFTQMILEGENATKAFLLTAIRGAKAMIATLVPQILGKEILEKGGFAGVASSAGLTALLYAGLATAEAAVAGAFKDGVARFKGKGTGTSDSNLVRISHGESVLTAKASADDVNFGFIKFANKTGGNIIDYIKANTDLRNTIAHKVYDDNAKHSKVQIIQLQDLIDTRNKENKELKDEIKGMRNELAEMKQILRDTKLIERKENYNVKVENKIVKAINQVDYSVM